MKTSLTILSLSVCLGVGIYPVFAQTCLPHMRQREASECHDGNVLRIPG